MEKIVVRKRTIIVQQAILAVKEQQLKPLAKGYAKGRFAVVRLDSVNRKYQFTMLQPDKERAVGEAQRLSQKHDGDRFAVLEVVWTTED
jgi:hypothetical protein